MQITRGKIVSAQKVVIYGPEGIGKSTFASQFPNPVFIDTEGSTKHMDVARLSKPSSWSMLLEQVRYIKANPHICGTLVIDTADWAEHLCADEICAKSQKNGIEDFGYGKGYVYLEEEFGRLLNSLEEIVECGINIVFAAHAQMRKFEQPDEFGAYDRWEMKLEKKTAPLLKEWADMVLFANYKTYVINVDGQGVAKGKNKAQGGKRVIYTSHHNCWDAKNRHNLPEELDFDFAAIAHCIPAGLIAIDSSSTKEPSHAAVSQTKSSPKQGPSKDLKKVETSVPSPKTESKTKPEASNGELSKEIVKDLPGVPKPLADLMMANNITVNEIQRATASRGYYPEDTPIENYDSDFVTGVLVAAWPQVFQMIQNIREEDEIIKDCPYK